VEVFDNDGNKITISFEGRVTREKVLQLLDIVQLMGGAPASASGIKQSFSDLSKIEKVKRIISRDFPVGWFTSRELQDTYENSLNEPIGLSTVSTYLSRLSSRGFLVRRGSAAKRRYKVNSSLVRKEQLIEP
jgi:hypothetical protein